MSASVEIMQVPRGSILLFKGIGFVGMEEEVVERLAQTVGHSEFLIINVAADDGTVDVWGPDADLAAKVEELLAVKR